MSIGYAHMAYFHHTNLVFLFTYYHWTIMKDTRYYFFFVCVEWEGHEGHVDFSIFIVFLLSSERNPPGKSFRADGTVVI